MKRKSIDPILDDLMTAARFIAGANEPLDTEEAIRIALVLAEVVGILRSAERLAGK